MDIYPTLIDLVGIDTPDTVEAMSLVKCFDGNTNVRNSMYFAYTDLMRSVKMNGYKLIEYANEHVKKTQLFDLNSDPFEKNDLSEYDEYKNTISELKKELFALRDIVNDKSHKLGEKFWRYYNE